MIRKNSINALLLAGGKSSRMGGDDKALIHFKNKPMIEHLLGSLPDVDNVIISCYRNQAVYKQYTALLAQDKNYPGIEPFAGPLLGILSAFDLHPSDHLLVLPCDTPDLSKELLTRMVKEHLKEGQQGSCLVSDGKIQPLHCVINSQLRDSLFQYLSQNQRSVRGWIEQESFYKIDCTEQKDQLRNINHPEDLME